MKKLFGVMMASALAVGASAAMAEGTQGGAQQQQQSGQKGATAQKQAMGRHEVQGHIVDLDKEKGNVKIQTDRGQLEFQFAPASIQNLNQGDEVRLEVAIRAAAKATVQPKQQPPQQPPQQP
jgi:hypothetical protein